MCPDRLYRETTARVSTSVWRIYLSINVKAMLVLMSTFTIAAAGLSLGLWRMLVGACILYAKEDCGLGWRL